MNSQLNGKSVLITGSSIGIGRAAARQFAREGAKVCLTYYKDKNEAQETFDTLSMGSQDMMMIELDVTDDDSVERAVNAIFEKYGGIDILVNNAGIIVRRQFMDQSQEDISKQIRTNLEGTMRVTSKFLPIVRDVIINMTAPTAFEPSNSLSVYSASKAGVWEFSQSLAEEVEDVKIFTLMPGPTATRMTGFKGDPPERVAEVMVATAAGRYQVENGERIQRA